MDLISGTYQKSAQGSQAIANRDRGLTPKLRSMLILVDGKRNVTELAKLSAMLGDTQQLLAQLLQEGYIEPVAAPAQAPGPAPAAPAGSAAAPRANVSLPEAQRFAVRRLTDLLGPTADDLCLRIEATRNAADFMQAAKRAEAVLREVLGTQAADAFMRDVEGHRPA